MLLENSLPVSQEVTMDTVYSHMSTKQPKIYLVQGVKQKIPLLLTLLR